MWLSLDVDVAYRPLQKWKLASKLKLVSRLSRSVAGKVTH